MTGNGLFAGLFARGESPAQLTEPAFLQAMLDVEVALLRGLARTGLAPAEAADELEEAADASTFDLAELGRSTQAKGTPVPGMLSVLRERVSEQTAAHVHQGATSQDVLDTAMMLVARRALTPIIADLGRAARACAELAERHRTTLLAGRTLLQQALPIPFGLKAAAWLTGLEGARDELVEVRDRGLAIQLGGAVGTLAALGDRGLEVAHVMAEELGLAEPELPWHTIRLRPVRLACALGAAVGVMGKVARDVTLLAQTEVAEAMEGGREGCGGSSTMPHKRNPVGAIAVNACAERTPALVATMLVAMPQEHERAAGAWQAEWETLLELLRLTGSAASTLCELLTGLELDPGRMRANLERTGALVMSESVAGAVSGSLGRPAAHRLVEQAAARALREQRPFRDVLLELPEVAAVLGETGLDEALDPQRYLGASAELIDRALAAHRTRTRP